jgi:alkanesulfonate monooxygenase SsuD/methylene tetrahydromethanopterin reductase-like flavin-dependent oxidoreductase (luciferase family)
VLAAARATERIQLGTSIAVAFARNPMTIAVTANDLHRASRGRFVLGLGTQVRAHVERRYPMPWSAPAERMREYVLAIRAI